MRLVINGQNNEFNDVTSVASLVERLGLKSDRLAIELNREIVPRANWPETSLRDDDKLEIVHFVGGGRYKSAK